MTDGVSSSGFHFFIGFVISVLDTEEFAGNSYPNACILSMSAAMAHVSHAYMHGLDQGKHQSGRVVDGGVLVVPEDF